MYLTGIVFMKTLKFKLFAQLVVLVSLAFSLSIAQARDLSWGTNSHANSPVRIDIVDDRGRTLNQYSANNRNYKTQRSYLEAIKGKRYQLRIRNTSNRRIGVVVAVDGRNILNGKKSYLRNNEKMYVLDPYESANYKGWRTSNNHINRFYFTSAGDSYSNAWGDRSAMGVIAVDVFNEKQKRYNKKKYGNELGKRLSPSQRGFRADESTGTGFGREEYSPTIRVNFKPKHQSSYKHFFKYEWRKTLCKRGIVNCNTYENNQNHNRFWPRESNNDFAPYPPSYNKSWADQFIVRGNNSNW